MYTTWVILLYYCINLSCYNVLLPTEYTSEKECVFYSTNVLKTYKSINNFTSDVKIRIRCRDTDLLWTEIYPI